MKTEANGEILKIAEAAEVTEYKAERINVIKKLIGIMLAVSAAVFGGVLKSLPSVLAFALIFTYIGVEIFMWITPQKNKKEKNKFF